MHRSQYSNALKYIEPRLLSPSTARFIPKREAQFGKSSLRNSTVMQGWVDAQNNFGAMIRLHFNAVFDSKEPTKLIAVDWAEGARWSVD